MVKEVIWAARAQAQLQEAYEYILQRSYQNCRKTKGRYSCLHS
jgi:plasmid stabilization system protein ParE